MILPTKKNYFCCVYASAFMFDEYFDCRSLVTPSDN